MTSKYARRRTAADYFFGQTGTATNLTRSDKRRLKHKRRGRRSEVAKVHRKKTVRVKGTDVETDRRVFFKFRTSNPAKTLKRLTNKGLLSIIRART